VALPKGDEDSPNRGKIKGTNITVGKYSCCKEVLLSVSSAAVWGLVKNTARTVCICIQEVCICIRKTVCERSELVPI